MHHHIQDERNGTICNKTTNQATLVQMIFKNSQIASTFQ